MNHWDAAAMGLIYLIYGLAFFVLGVVASMLPKQNTTWHFAPHLSLLAAFGMLHGIVEFIEIQKLSNPAEWLNWLGRLLLLTSYLPLLEFGRRTWIDNSGAIRLPASGVFGAAGLGVAMLALWMVEPLAGLTMGARWFVGAPAALLTGFALFVNRRPNITRRNALWLRIVALAFIGYSLSTVVLFQSDPRLPVWLPTQADFLALFGVPVQLLRALCAVAATLGFVSLVREAGKNSQVDAVVFDSDDSIVITDVNCVVLRVNKAFTKSTGYTAAEAVGRKMNLLKSGRHDDNFYALMWESINRTGAWQGEIWDKRKNGEIYPKWLTITALKDAADVVIHYVGRHIDISERKQTEQVLNQLQAMIDISLNGFWITDLIGNMLQVNEAYAKMVGYSIDELITMRISQFEAIEGPEQVKAHIAKVIAQGYDQFETRHRHKDGHTIDLEISAAFLPEFQQFCVFCRDITERKLMEDELKASEAKFRSLIEASPIPMVLYDEQLNITFLNPAFVQTFGYSMDDIPTMADWRPKAYPDPDYRHWVETIWKTTLEKAKQEKTNFPPLELAIRCKNNSIKTVLASAAAIHHDFAGMHLVILYDITQRKQQEQQDKEHLDELAHVTRLGLMGEMASGIAHEVNQPLAAISSYTQVSLNLINSEHPDLVKLSEILGKTQQQALRAGGIIHHMRQFVKSHVIHRSTADVNTLIHDAAGLCVAELKQNDISLTFELENNLPSIGVDQIQIEQVIINLVRNSIEALQNLPAKQQRELIIHSHLTPNNCIQVRVKDNGPGMDEDQRQKISTPFYTTKPDGMGMGLSISRSLIEAHKGTLHFNSMPGKGSTFYFTLPIEKAEEA